MTIADNSHVAITTFAVWNDEDYWQKPEARNQRFFEVESALGTIGKRVYDHYRAQTT
ncbi:MAG: hypothetical protein IPK19_06820 [Chloroflexi bacterium]|nr:hypothetical protein [Chloroflexota bacterium]